MANLGAYSTLLRDDAWYSPLVVPEGWFEGELNLTAPLIASAAAGQTFTIEPGAVTWTGQSVTATITYAISPGAVTWAGANVLINTVRPITPGAVTWTGQTVNFFDGAGFSITPGAVTWSGQNVAMTLSRDIQPGALLWAGQNVGLNLLATIQPGAITWAGGSVNFADTPPGTDSFEVVKVGIGAQVRWRATLRGGRR